MLGYWEQSQLDNLALSVKCRQGATLTLEECEIRFTTLIINLFRSGSTLDDLNPQSVYAWAIGKGWDAQVASFASTTVLAVHRTLVYVEDIPGDRIVLR